MTDAGSPTPHAANMPRRAAALAAFFAEVAPRLHADLVASGTLQGADSAVAHREYQAAALHACVRGAVSDGGEGDATADLVDGFHDIALASLAPDADAAERAHLATRYGEYDGITRSAGGHDSAGVPAAIAAACARHVRPSDRKALADTLTPLLEALAEGAAAVLAANVQADATLPSMAGLRAITARLDAAGIAWGVGASTLLASFGLVDHVNDWDVQVDADPEPLRELFADTPHTFHGHSGCHADWKLSFEAERTELIPRFAFFVPDGVVRLPLHVSGHWQGLPIASPEAWACAYWLMGQLDERELRARRAARADLMFAHLAEHGADAARVEALQREPLPALLAAKLSALPRR